MARPSSASTQSPPRRTSPRGRSIATSSPLASEARWRLFWRRSNGRRNSPAGSMPRAAAGLAGRRARMTTISEEEIALRHRQLGGGLAGEQFAVGAHLVGLGIDLELRLQGVVHHVALADAARIAHRLERLGEPEVADQR